MAFCHQCGNTIADSDKFCASCGAKVLKPSATCAEPAEEAAETIVQGAEEAEAAAKATDAADDAAEKAALDALSAEPVETAQPTAAQPVAGANAAAPQTEPVAQPAQPAPAPEATVPVSPYADAAAYAAYAQAPKGPLAQAWADFMAAPKKLLIMLKLVGAMFLPGANLLILEGYTCHWGKDAALGRKSALPEKLIRPGVLDSGLYAYLTMIIYCVVLFLAYAIVETIFDALSFPDVISSLVMLAASVVFVPVVYAAQTRAIICGRVRDGLNVSAVFNEVFGQGKFGKMFVASYVPTIVAAIVCMLVLMVFGGVGTLFASAVSSVSYVATPYANYAYSAAPFSSIGLLFMGLIMLVIICFLVFFICSAAALISERAMGYIYEEFEPQNWPEYKENSERLAKEAF